ncbi:MAG: 4-hydroxythreonine-4-phosphate dehydrogenase PdxA [Myxococcaceae bacterium]
MKPVVGISLGDPSGIGPEVVAAALALPRVRRALTAQVYGDASFPGAVAVTRLARADRRPGKPTLAGGSAQVAYVQAVIDAARAGEVDAICTAPVSKEQITRAGVPFMGHTEALGEAFGCDVMMLMDGPRLRVALATNHVPLAELSKLITRGKLVAQLKLLSASLKPVLKRIPKLAVCGLNPHAGEGGYLGREEVEVIAPAVAEARQAGVKCEGPIAADGLFARAAMGKTFPYDAVLAMFHDQGLIATKTLDFVHTVNVTLGLPLPRTSPDHGVAYDLAGKNQADPTPMIEALLKAADLTRAIKSQRSLERLHSHQ